MLYIAQLAVFGIVFVIPIGVAVFGEHGCRGRWDSILVGLFTGVASVGLVTGCIALVLIFAPEILVGGVGWEVGLPEVGCAGRDHYIDPVSLRERRMLWQLGHRSGSVLCHRHGLCRKQ